MLNVILLILKIIGIVLLCILGFLVLVLCVILFVPVRYRLTARKNEEPEELFAQAKITWLLHIVSISAFFQDGEFQTILRLFGIRLHLGERKKKARKNEKETKSESRKVTLHDSDSEEIELIEKQPDTSNNSEQKINQPDTIDSPKNAADESISFISKCKEFFYRIVWLIKDFRNKIRSFLEKIVQMKDNIDYYIDFFEDERNQKAFRLCIDQFGIIFHHIRPRKFHARIHIGMGDPAATGQLLAALGIIFPLFEGKLKVEPEFDDSILEGDLYLKGHITAFVMLKVAWKIYFNKDIRRMMHKLKKEDE